MPLNLKDYEMKPLFTGGEVIDLIFLETSEKLKRVGEMSIKKSRELKLPHHSEFEALMKEFYGWLANNIKSGRFNVTNDFSITGSRELKREEVFQWLVSGKLIEHYQSENIIIRKEVCVLVERFAKLPETKHTKIKDTASKTQKSKKGRASFPYSNRFKTEVIKLHQSGIKQKEIPYRAGITKLLNPDSLNQGKVIDAKEYHKTYKWALSTVKTYVSKAITGDD